MNYDHVQFIAYCINTAPKAEWNGTNWKQKYLGLQDALMDIKQRVALVKTAIDIAYNNSQKQNQTLKIFMIPEFFFRGSRGAYAMPKVHKVVEDLQKLVKDKKWQDWIFVFGSIVGFSSPTITGKKRKREEIDESKDKEIYNFTLVQQGGFEKFEDAHNYARVVMKELKSGIDFIQANNITGKGLVLERVIYPLTVNQERNELSDSYFAGTSIFDMKGIRFGLELCLDHDQKRLKKSREYQKGTSDGIVDIQLIPSCGMSIDLDAIVVRNGGYVFNCDGLTSLNKKTTENTGREIHFNDGSKAYDSHSALLIKTNSNFNSLKDDKVTKHDITGVNVVSQIYAQGAGQLHIYTPQALPTASSTLSSSKSLFPPSQSSFTTALSSEPVLLNGMKVIFDQPTPVYPVNLQPKDK
ncbi:MAG: hypothetical protein F6K18_05265 [Okeania sp. SIO2C2]|uniref:hypothetical protein n=1 Tax=Okeania sp. SIO2C2 TaxID=2607787 RepID=UPI0013B5F003|nr:hypothetical protein [Okeania sp. SIO2C2]NEP86278.1 hypothetical protein [Okeania sp. SIO2C2]